MSERTDTYQLEPPSPRRGGGRRVTDSPDGRGAPVRSLAGLFLIAPTVVLVWLLFPHTAANDVGIVVVCLSAYAVGGVLYALSPDAAPNWVVKAAVAVSTVMISVVVYFAGDSDAGLGLLYVWATPYAFFFSGRHAVFQIALVAGTLLVALLTQPWIPGELGAQLSAQEPARWLLVVVSVVVVGSLVRRLGGSLRESHARIQRGFEDSPLGLALVGIDQRLLEVNSALASMLGRTREQVAAMSIAELTHPEDRVIIRDAVEAGLRDQEARWSFEQRYLHADGRAVPVRVNISLVRDGARPLYFFAQIEDITERRRHEAELARRARQQEAVARLGQVALRGQGGLNELMQEVALTVSATLDVDLSAVLELRHADQTLTFAAGCGWGEEVMARATFSVAEINSQGAYTLASKQPVVVDDVQSEMRFRRSAFLAACGVQSGVTVIIEGDRQPFGILAAHALSARAFTADDVNFMQAVANVLSSAVDRRRVEEHIRHAALHDELTALPNRRLALDRIGQALRRRGRAAGSVAVMMVDLDRFKVINDSLGHAAGDELLVALVPRLREALRPADTIARLGGDEFVVVCEALTGPREAAAVAERLAASVAPPVRLSDGVHQVSVSVGIAVASCPEDTADSLLRDADAAMYRAKERGRGRYELFDEAMREQVIRRLQTEHDLRRALDAGELRVHYQPIIDLSDRRPIGVEALVRWQHPDRGLLAPGEFIAVAEESGLIGELGLWVLRDSCRQTAEWQRTFSPGLELSVNVSGRQVAQPAFPAQVTDIVRASGLAAGTLKLEITESVLIEEADAPMTVLSELRDRDLQLVLDDFGTGFSSLSYLQRFPLDGLKIDRSFVAGLNDETGDGSAIVDAVTRMAAGLNLHLVAEGVETEMQAARLIELGCTYAQGYLFARPMPAEQVSEYLAAAVAATPTGSARAEA
jgi:diguanylate cyclase (GGDEF)-like protein/PAS domain S-box-containing protein